MVFGAIPEVGVLDRIQTVQSRVDQVRGDVELVGDDPRVQGPGERLSQPPDGDEGPSCLLVDDRFLARDQPARTRATPGMHRLMGQGGAQLWEREPPVDRDRPISPPAAAPT